MKIYIAITTSGMYVTANENLARLAVADLKDELKALQEWEVKTQGKNFNSWAKGRYIIKRSI